MSQVTCSQCGGANPPRSKYCNLCGHELPPATSVVCPRCQRDNPLHLMYCDECGARLHEAAPPPTSERRSRPESASTRAIDLPLRTPDGDEALSPPDAMDSAALTDWLRLEGIGGAAPDAPEEDDGPASGHLGSEDPSELIDVPESPADAEPWEDDVLSAALPADEPEAWADPPAEAGDAPSTAASPFSEFARWLEDQEEDEPPPEVAAPAPTPADEPTEAPAPPEDEPDPEAAGFQLDWLNEAGPPIESAAIDLPAAAGDLPDWLDDAMSDDGVKSDEAGDAFAELLAGMPTDPTAEAPSPPESPVGADAWFDGDDALSGDESLGAAEDTGEDDAEASEPDWLDDFSSLPTAEDEAGAQPWLSDAQADDLGARARDESDAEATRLAAGDFPTWLQEASARPDPDEGPDDGPVPDWLSGLADVAQDGADLPSLPDDPSALAVPASEAPAEPDDPLDWLAELGLDDQLPDEPNEMADAELEDESAALAPGAVDAPVAAAEAGAAGEDDAWDDFDDEAVEPEAGTFQRWLKGAAVETIPEPPTVSEFDQWLDDPAELEAAEPDGPEPPAAMPAPPAVADGPDIPEWLRGPDGPAELALPDLDGLADELEAAPAEQPGSGGPPEPAPAAPPDELPDWLATMREGNLGPAGEEAAPTRQTGPASRPESFADIPADLVSGELPDWLLDSQPLDTDGPGLGLPGILDSPVSGPVDPLLDESLPEWLRPDDATFNEALDAAMAARSRRPKGEASGGEWSDFLDGATLDELPGDLELPSAREFARMGDKDSRSLAAADIPDWLQPYKPRELRKAGETELPDEPIEESGPLAGLRGVVDIEPLIAAPHTDVRAPAPFAVSAEHREQVKLLHRLAASGGVTALDVVSESGSALSRGARLLLALALLATALLGALAPSWLAGIAASSAQAPAAATSGALEAIMASAGRPVLIAFAYTPAFEAELAPQAELLLRQLAALDSPVLAISGSAAGVTLADRAFARVPDARGVNLGLLPGELAGLRALGACLREGAACQTVAGKPMDLGQFGAEPALLLVITGDRGRLVGWIEQVALVTERPLVAAVTQSLAPVTTPYFVSGRLAGVVGGETEAAAYERQWLGAGEAMNNRAAASVPARWLAILLLIGGNAYHLANGLRRRGRGSGEAAA